MKKTLKIAALFTAFAVLCLVPKECEAQVTPIVSSVNLSATTGAQAALNLSNFQAGTHVLTWVASGTVSTCTVQLESSAVGVTFALMTSSAAQTCTTTGAFAVSGQVVNFARMNVTALTGSGNVTFTLTSYPNTPVQMPVVGSLQDLTQLTGASTFNYTDGEMFIPATVAGCLVTPTTLTQTLTTVRSALNNTVLNSTTNAAAGSEEWDCDIGQAIATRTTSGKGITITAINVLYGAQAATPTSLANANFSTLTYPAVGGVASGTVSSALATTVTVGMSHSTPTSTTTGQCVNEGNVLTTPLAFTALIPRLTYSQVFSQTAASAMTIQLCGFQILYKNVPF